MCSWCSWNREDQHPNTARGSSDQECPWTKWSESWVAVWMPIPEVSVACRELMKYSFKRHGTTCQCIKPRLDCSLLCKCICNTTTWNNDLDNFRLVIYSMQDGRKEMFYLTTHSTHLFSLRLYGVGHMVKDHSDSERGNPLPPLHGLLFPISSKGSFICIIPQIG